MVPINLCSVYLHNASHIFAHIINISIHFSSLHNLSSYKSVVTYATVPDGDAEVVDFKLTRIHDMISPAVPKDSSEEEFQSFIKQLSLGPGLDQLIQSTATTSSFLYHGSMELSEFLRSLNLNFPKITSLRRYCCLTFTQQLIFKTL